MKSVLITGASRGIGESIRKIYEQNCYNVFAPSREELDLLDSNSIDYYIEKYSKINFDVIVNNAGINVINNIENISNEEIDDMMRINLIAPLKLIRGFVKGMRKNRFGHIVNIGSIWGAVAKPGRSVYSITKHGIHGLTQTLALELAPDNILVNTVAPGFTLTQLTEKNNTAEQIEFITKNIPIGRMAKPVEIAEIVYYLGSESNTYITGQQIVVDGGYSIR